LLLVVGVLVGTAHLVLEEMAADFLAEHLMAAEVLNLLLEQKLEMGLKPQVLYKVEQLTVETKAEEEAEAEATLVVALARELKVAVAVAVQAM
jgi:hypothetical protein